MLTIRIIIVIISTIVKAIRGTGRHIFMGLAVMSNKEASGKGLCIITGVF